MKVKYKISAQYVKAWRIKVRKLPFQLFKFQKGHNSYKSLRKFMTLDLHSKFIKWKSYTQFQLNMTNMQEKKREIIFSVI